MNGTLYVVATPIGNLEDMTHRAVRVLRECSLIACEDTRRSRVLLDHYGIEHGAARPLLSYYRQNESARSSQILEQLAAGANVALICDAGTPLLADPGARLVRQALEAGIAVVPVPGPSAAITALMASATEPPVLLLSFLPARAG
ncbi:MAG: 16S rRNA (cytidine(1402)-2'-O)-methyltransferase, partial [Terriglobales bacterium]